MRRPKRTSAARGSGTCCTASTRTAAARGAAEADGGGGGQRGVGHGGELCGGRVGVVLRRRRRGRAPRRAARGVRKAAITSAALDAGGARLARCCLRSRRAARPAELRRDGPDSRRRPTTSSAERRLRLLASNLQPAAHRPANRDGGDLTRAPTSRCRAAALHQVVPGVAARRAAAQLAKLTGALGAADAELRRLCDRVARTRRRRPSTRRRVGVARLAAADAKRAEHLALAARGALRVLQRFADSLRTLGKAPARARRDRPQGPRSRASPAAAGGGQRARRRRASSATPSGCCARGASSAASKNCARAARLAASRRRRRAPTRAAPFVEKSLSCLAAALHLGARRRSRYTSGRRSTSSTASPTPAAPMRSSGGCEVTGWRPRSSQSCARRPRRRRRWRRRSLASARARAYLASDGAKLLSSPRSRDASAARSTCSRRRFGPKSSTSSLKRCRGLRRGHPDAFQRNYLYWRGCSRRWRGGSTAPNSAQAFREAPHTAAFGKAVVAADLLPAARQTHHRGARRFAAAAVRAHRRRRRRRGARGGGGGRDERAPAVRTAAAAAAAAAIRAPFARTSTSLHCRRG